MGSEMCIRDRLTAGGARAPGRAAEQVVQERANEKERATAQTVARIFTPDGGSSSAAEGKHKKYEELQQQRRKREEAVAKDEARRRRHGTAAAKPL